MSGPTTPRPLGAKITAAGGPYLAAIRLYRRQAASATKWLVTAHYSAVLSLAVMLPVLFCTSLLLAQGVVGKVVRVIDGDTIEVLHGGSPDRVRLAGIDCPEKNQPFGSRAKQATSYLAFGQQVTLQLSGKDKYNRTLAEVILPDGRSLNKELVRQGMAWWYRKYSSDLNCNAWRPRHGDEESASGGIPGPYRHGNGGSEGQSPQRRAFWPVHDPGKDRKPPRLPSRAKRCRL